MPADVPPAQADREVALIADHLFREEAGKLVSVLTRIFGVERLQMAEDVVQEALIRALHTWPFHGVPANPAAWITQTAKNLALDRIRREKLLRSKESEISDFSERWSSQFGAGEVPIQSEIEDSRLRMIFVCCHPSIPEDAQASLALKTLCGFGTGEIASAFLTSEAAIAKRLTRARQKLRDDNVPYEIPSGEDLGDRVDGVLKTIYLLFNEGYKASSGESLIRKELCAEAIRLGMLVAQHRSGDRPRTHALLALMLLNSARLGARTDPAGSLVRLESQDRSVWDQETIARGLRHLGLSASGGELSWAHLQAAIAALHCTAKDYESTDWRGILALYDDLMRLDGSPVVALNRAVAVAHVHGPKAGIEAVEAIRNRDSLESYHLLYAVMAEFEVQLNDFDAAAEHLRTALKFTETASEREHLSKKLHTCGLHRQA